MEAAAPEESDGGGIASPPACSLTFTASDDLELEIMNHIRKRLSPLAMPQEIEFVDSLPKTRSGKIVRRVLRCKEFHEPVGDLSTVMNE